MSDIFISYARPTEGHAEQIAEALKALATPWPAYAEAARDDAFRHPLPSHPRPLR